MYKESVEKTKTTGLVEHLIQKHGKLLIAILQDIQKQYNYLPEDVLREVAGQLEMPLRDIYGVVTFYRSFSLEPRGKHLLSVCLGTACHVRNAPSIAGEIGRQLQVKPGQTTTDKEFTFETVNCLGACALGPIVVVDGQYFSNVKASDVSKILTKAKKGLSDTEIKDRKDIFPVEVSCSHCNHSFMNHNKLIDGYPSVQFTVAFNREHGWYRLSSLYGSFNFESEYDIPLNYEVNVFCPHCHAELQGGRNCPECSLSMIPLIVKQGGIVHVCPRKGCHGHILDV